MIRITFTDLRRLAPRGSASILAGLAAHFDAEAEPHGVTTPLRICHFLAQACHETDGFRTLQEYGGTAYFARYDGRADLGNVHPGDGARFHGRGIFQLTGRANYVRMGLALGLDLMATPDRAADPEISLRIAFQYWTLRRINDAADADDLESVTRKINGGVNGLANRRQLLGDARLIWCA